jgi:hypothetical protein
MPDEPSVLTIEHVLRSDRSLQVLTYLHEQRLRAATDCLTIPVEELPGVIDDLRGHAQEEPSVTEGRAAILSKMLREEWLPAMDACTMVKYDSERDEVTATPRTTLFYLVVQPDHLDQRDRDELASACGWLAWRDPFCSLAAQRSCEDQDEDSAGGGE